MKLFHCFTLASAFLVALVALPRSAADYSNGIREPLRVNYNVGDNDSERLRKLLQQTHGGVPEYDISTIHPLIIPSLDVYFDSDDLLYENRNVTVTGVKDQKILDFKLDNSGKYIVLKMLADLTIDGYITGTFTRLAKTIAGRYWSQESVLSTATCNYELRLDGQGVERIAIGPEVITCEVVNTPNVQLDLQLEQALCADAHASRMHLDPTKRNELRKNNVCKIVERVYKTVIQNIRAWSKILPASAFLKNLR